MLHVLFQLGLDCGMTVLLSLQTGLQVMCMLGLDADDTNGSTVRMYARTE